MTNKKLFGLGRGLGSLIPESGSQVSMETTRKESVFYVEVGKIRQNPDQPRKEFEKNALSELSKSVRKYGVLQPLLVSKIEEETQGGMNVYYELIAGERRWRAAQLAGLPTVPVIVRDEPTREKSQRIELALVENLQREDLNPMEEAEAYSRMSSEFGLTQKEIAEKVSKSREAVANLMRLEKLPDYVKDALRGGKITAAHAKALLALPDAAKQKSVYEQILKGGFSSKDVESTAASENSGKKSVKKNKRFVELEQNLSEHLKMPVLIRSGGPPAGGGGSPRGEAGNIVIKFITHEELNEVAKKIID